MPEAKRSKGTQPTEKEKVAAMFRNAVEVYLPYANEARAKVEEFKKSHPQWDAFYHALEDPSDPAYTNLPLLIGTHKIEAEINVNQLGEIASLAASISQILSAATPTRVRWDSRNEHGPIGKGYNRSQSYTFIPKNIRQYYPK